MNYELKKLPGSKAELTITVQPAEYEKNMADAAVRVSEKAKIPGFRPGKAPYATVKQQVGEIRILEEAMQSIVEHNYTQAVLKEQLDTIGAPEIVLKKFAPGNELVFLAQVSLLPKVTLPQWDTITATSKPVKLEQTEIDETMENLRKMQRGETAKEGVATKDDKVVIELNMFLDSIPVEGGTAKNHQVYLSEPHYIPGLAEQLVGLTKDASKEFTLRFPKEHYQKHLADKDIDFKIKVNEVFELTYPELNDEFAKTLGQESLTKLVEVLTTNLTAEATKKEDQRLEIALLEDVIAKSAFEEIPEVIIDAEKRKMYYELRSDLDRRSVSIEDYLKNIKKTQEDIFKDFTDGATKRAKAALISRQVAKENNILVDKKELDAEVERIKMSYPGDETITENLKHPEVLDTLKATVQNRKVVTWIKEKILPVPQE